MRVKGDLLKQLHRSGVVRFPVNDLSHRLSRPDVLQCRQAGSDAIRAAGGGAEVAVSMCS